MLGVLLVVGAVVAVVSPELSDSGVADPQATSAVSRVTDNAAVVILVILRCISVISSQLGSRLRFLYM